MSKLWDSSDEQTGFGRWVVERLRALGKGEPELERALGTRYLLKATLTIYPSRTPLPSTIADLARILEVTEAVVRARLAGHPVSGDGGERARRLEARIPDIVALFDGHAEVKTVLGSTLPEVVQWPRPLPEDVVELAAEIRPTLQLNQPQLLVDHVAQWERRPLTLRGTDVDFASVAALRKLGRRPAVLSASAVVCTVNPPALMLHRRAELPHTTYGNCLHTLGGAFHPDRGTLGSVGTDRDLHDTLLREVFEESRLRASLDACTGLILEETRTGFIQYLGLGVTAGTAVSEVNAEGMSELVRPADLLTALCEDRWVPTGRLAVLLWLAAGAPGLPEGPVFGGLTAEDVLSRVIDSAPLEHLDP